MKMTLVKSLQYDKIVLGRQVNPMNSIVKSKQDLELYIKKLHLKNSPVKYLKNNWHAIFMSVRVVVLTR